MSQAESKLFQLRRALFFVARNPRAGLLLIRMTGWVGLISLLLKIFSLERSLRLITPRPRTPRTTNSEKVQTELSDLVDLLLSTNFWFVTPTCWKRAPLLYRYLALEGITTRVVFGVKKNESTLDGHAWLEAGGRPVLEKSPPDYKVTFCYPA